MRILVLGGSGFVGRAVASEAVARGDTVTVVNRGAREPVPGVHTVVADRRDPGFTVPGGTWDAVVDTWSAQAQPVRTAARLLRGRAGHYTYVSSRSVYAYPTTGLILTEEAPLVDVGDPGYAGDKLRGEQGTAAFAGPVLLARAGLILGPHEDVGRLPWWLRRLHRGGPVLAPGPQDLPLQYVDARDLATFVLDAAAAGVSGPVNTVSAPGHTTMGELLTVAAAVTGGRARLHWTDPQVILDAGIEPWTQLPIWLPPGPDHTFLHTGDVSRALGLGLRCRPVQDTVADTWEWLSAQPADLPTRADRPPVGLDPAVEATLLPQPFAAS
ncbi:MULTISPECIES: NAD-dependent epimerase/dehydratase family protein [Actinoplanes]|uniref:NAD-dependent epimerase/dehydratase family protein n=1 Tax=Actinoplanes TaxID=1865 RepID=UPI0005F2F985|nr:MULTISPECIES: NAD-dependent epimerase/dehydratase family protein [Actinoplanes]GLY03074.1 reductase [Actinoplanes sp. NBRC 101535]